GAGSRSGWARSEKWASMRSRPPDMASTTLANPLTERLDSAEALAVHLAALVALDPRLAAIAERAGDFEVRRSPGGFAGLARIVPGQQVSTQSADAIWGRFSQLEGALD